MRPARAIIAAGLWLGLALGQAPGAGAVAPHPGLATGSGAALDLGRAWAEGLDRPVARGARPADRLLVLLVDFPDRPHAPNLTRAWFDSLFFGPASSVRDFYRRSSYDRLDLSGTVSPWLRLPQAYAFYADAAREGAGVRGTYPRNARRMAEDAVRAADALLDFARFDADGPDGMPASGDDDGVVDALLVVHAGEGAELGDARDILSHTWSTQGAVRTADGVDAYRYSTVAETSPLGVAAHEFGHLLGLSDLYQRGSLYGLGGGLGDWSLMGTGSWLDGGRAPADLDAASKLDLGFVDPVVPAAGGRALPLRAPRDGAPGTVYQIWTHGRADREYLVVENRQPRGLDAALPGGGMLVFHVDLAQADNADPDRPRVELLQADGHQDIERRINNGDAGDPYPGSRLWLGASTTPGTRARDGADSQIRIDAISAPTSNMTFDLQVETTPCIVIEQQVCREIQGDGDGHPEAGELLALELRLRNLGAAADSLRLAARDHPPGTVSWTGSWPLVPRLAKLDTASVSFVFQTTRTDLPDPLGLDVVLELSAASAWRDSISTIVGLGSRSDFRACFELGPEPLAPECHGSSEPWSVVVLRGPGAWTLEPRAGELGGVYRSARGPRYANGVDVALVSPTFLLRPGSTLRLLHAYQTQDDAAGWAYDGGRVEVSLDAGAWEPLAPRAGHPRRLRPESVPALARAGVFAGTSPRRWDEFDLGAHSGGARLRFRFVAGDSIGSAGWEVARVEVAQGGAPPRPEPILAVQAAPNPGRPPLRIAWRITAPLTAPARPTTLGIYDLRGRLVRGLVHPPVPAESALFEWNGADGSGHRVASGIYIARLEWGEARGAAKILVVW